MVKKFTKLLCLFLILPALKLNAQNAKYPEMILVKGGTFQMGNNQGNYDDEKPVHSVSLSDFYISKYEVTVGQYRKFCKATTRMFPSDPPADWYEEYDEVKKWEWKNDHPIVNVSWYDAVAYCKWLSKETGENYTLPTEAQWEFAARGGTISKGYKYSGSDNINEVSWYDETTGEKGTKPVGKLKPNELGIYDMSGNAWEWCLDKYGKYQATPQKDPTGSTKGQYVVVRGGSWYYVDEMSRITARDGPLPSYNNFNYGFRVVKIIPKN